MKEFRLILHNFFGLFLNVLIGLMWFYLIRTFTSVEDIGIFYLIQAKFLIFSFLTHLGLSFAYLKFSAEIQNKNKLNQFDSTFLFIKSLQFGIFIIFIFIVYFNDFVFSVNKAQFLICFLSVLFDNIFNSIFTPIFISRGKVLLQRFFMSFGIISKTILLLFIFQNQGLVSLNYLFSLNLFGSALILMFSLPFFVKSFSFSKIDIEMLKQILKYSFPFTFSTSSRILYNNSLTIMIANFGTSKDIANFATAFQMYSYISLIPISISQILIGSFSRSHSNIEEFKNLKIRAQKVNKFLTSIFLIIFLGSFFFSDFIFSLIFGISYDQTGKILTLLIIDRIFLGLIYGYYILLQAKSNVFISETLTIIRTVLLGTSYLFFASIWYDKCGIYAITYINIICTSLYCFLFALVVHIKYKYNFNFDWFKQIIILSLVCFVFLIINSIYDNFIFNGIVGISSIICFIGLLLISRIYRPTDLQRLFAKRVKIGENHKTRSHAGCA